MQVYEIEVTFMRKRQPKEYENAQAEVTLKASLEDGEDHGAAMNNLLDSASSAVYERLGLNVAQGTQSTTAKTSEGSKGSGGKASTGSKGKNSKTQQQQPAQQSGTSDLPDDGGSTQKQDGDDKSGSDDLPEEKPAPAPAQDSGSSSVTHGDVQGLISRMVKDKVCSVNDCKGILKEYGVDRTQDLPADKLEEVKDRIEALGL